MTLDPDEPPAAGASATESPWGEGKVRPTQPEPRPPAVTQLGPWWLVALGVVAGIVWAATDHMLRATVTLGAACLLGAGCAWCCPLAAPVA